MLDIHNHNLDAIDQKAEREAAALSWMEEELGIPQPLPLFQKRQRVPINRNCRYARATSLLAHSRLSRASWSTLVHWSVAERMEITTSSDRARRRIARRKRQALLAKLSNHPAEYVPFREALRLAGIATRSLHRGIQQGAVKRISINGVIHVAVAGLRDYAASLRSCRRSSQAA